MKQQPYFIRLTPNLSSPHLDNKNVVISKEETPSNSQGSRRKTPIITQPLHSPAHIKDLFYQVPKYNPTLRSPLPQTSTSKLKIINDFSVYKMPTARRLKSDDLVTTPQQNKKLQSHHLNNIKFRKDRKLNFTPLVKMKTEPNDIHANSNNKQDDSQDILFRLHRQSIPTEPNDKLQSILGHQITRSVKKNQSNDQANHFFIKIDNDIQLISETKEKKQNLQQINSEIKDKILDLLCLSTQDLKTKFAELNKVGNSKINTRQSNKLLIPKRAPNKFPTDFFNALLPNSILH